MKTIFASFIFLLFAFTQAAFAQKMTVKDDVGNVLMEVNDEGTVGSITLPQGGEPVLWANKLYNVGGVLYWNGAVLDKMPSQTGHGGKYLTTDGTTASWTSLTIPDGHSLDAADGSPTDALYVDNDGEVGIGTTAPGSALEVIGQVKITGGSPGSGKVLTSDASGLGSWQAGDEHSLDAVDGSPTDALYVDSDGEVGIGTTSPAYTLDVDGNMRAHTRVMAKDNGTIGSVHMGSGNATNTGFIEWRLPAADGALGTRLGYMGYSQSDIFLDLENNADFFVNGDVGIGVADPGAKLEVNGQVKITGGSPGANKVLTSDAAGLATWQPPAVATGNTLDGAYDQGGAGAGRTITADNGAVKIAGTGGLEVDANTVLGASTSSTETLSNAGFSLSGDDLFVAGMAGIEGSVYTDQAFIAGATTTYSDGSITKSSGSALNVNLGGAAGDDFIVDTSTLVVESDNNRVGIGTSTPDVKLHVVGDIKIVDGNQAAGKVLTSDANGKASWNSHNVMVSEVIAITNAGNDFWVHPTEDVSVSWNETSHTLTVTANTSDTWMLMAEIMGDVSGVFKWGFVSNHGPNNMFGFGVPWSTGLIKIIANKDEAISGPGGGFRMDLSYFGNNLHGVVQYHE